jgi:hypothetical protein
MDTKIDNPADCEVRSVIRFLNAQNVLLVEFMPRGTTIVFMGFNVWTTCILLQLSFNEYSQGNMKWFTIKMIQVEIKTVIWSIKQIDGKIG